MDLREKREDDAVMGIWLYLLLKLLWKLFYAVMVAVGFVMVVTAVLLYRLVAMLWTRHWIAPKDEPLIQRMRSRFEQRHPREPREPHDDGRLGYSPDVW